MPVFNVRSPEGQLFRVTAPEGATQEEIISYAQSQMGQFKQPGQTDFSRMSTAELEAMPSAPSSISDVARSLGIGVVGGAKSLADVFGAGSDISEYLGETASGLQKGLTPARQAEIAKRQELEKRAAESGDTFKEFKTFLGGVAEAPLQSMAQGVGSSAPTLLASLAAIPAGAPAGLALGVGAISRYALGAAQGVGELKGSILDAVENEYIKAGYPKEQARELALKAQEYSIDKAAEIGGSALLGALDAFTGIESGVSKAAKAAAAKKLAGEMVGKTIEDLPEKALTRPGLLGSAARSALGEAPLEGAQGGFGEYATNRALIQEGLLDPDQAMKGVFGAAARDAAVGLLTGGAFTPVEHANRMREFQLDQALRQQQEQETIDSIRKGLEEEEKPYALPGGFVIEPREIGRETAPMGFNIMAGDREEPLTIVDTAEEAEAKLKSMTELRNQEAANLLAEEQKINGRMGEISGEMARLEAIGQTKTPQHEKLVNESEKLTTRLNEIYDTVSSLREPLTAVPFGEQERVTNEYVLKNEAGEEVGVYESQKGAEAKVMEITGEEPFKEKELQRATLQRRAQFIRQLQKFGLGDVGLKIVEKIENGAGGAYLDKLIRVSMEDDKPLQTMRHEALHALKDLGFFTDQQWNALKERAKKEWIEDLKKDQYSEGKTRHDAYIEMFTQEGKDKGLDGKELDQYVEDSLIEEAIADAFGAYDKGAKPPPGLIAALFKKLKNFFANLRQALRGAGFESAEDIFQKIERGELKAARAAQPSAEEKLSLAPAGIPQKIWDLHEKVQQADEEATGRVAAGKAPGALKRNQTMSFRRLNQAVMDFVGGDEQKADDLMVQMNQESSRRAEKFSLKRPAVEGEVEISTQNPSGPKRAYDPIAQMLSIDEKAVMEAMKSNPDYRTATIKAIKSYGFIPEGVKDKDVIELFKNNIVDNLLYLYNLVPEDIRKRSKLWYDGANKIAKEMADKYGLSLRQVSAIMAAMSPQKDWFQNVSMGERAIDILTKHGDRSWTPEMLKYAESYVKETKDRAEREKRQEAFEKIKQVAARGTTLNNMDIKSAAAFIRAYDEAFHSRQYRIVTPEGGFGNNVVNDDGTPSTLMWSTYSPIEKAVSIYRDGSRENVSEQLGFEHKIRSFYNNIAAPNSDLEHVTIDTHAVAAALFESLAGTDPEVVQNFGGTGKTKITGVGGTYGLIAEAYREAAKKVGVLPREMQSITWEAVRGLFSQEIKNAIKNPVKAEWAKYKSGEISFEQARQNIIEISRNKRSNNKNVDIPPPDWVGSGDGQFVEDGGESYDKFYIPAGGVRLREEQEIREKLTFNLSAVTNSIPGLRELYARALKRDKKAVEVLQSVAESSLTHLLSGTKARVKIERAKGVYLADREPSLMVSVAFNESESADVLAALARFAKNFNQQQIHVRTGTNKQVGFDYKDGSYVTPVFTIPLKKELSDKDVSSIIENTGLQGFTVTEDSLITYFVRPEKLEGEGNAEYAKRAKQAGEEFAAKVKSAHVLAGRPNTKVGTRLERLFVYGSGEGAAIDYESIGGDVRPKQASDTITPKLIAEYLTGKPVQVFKQKDLTKAQVAQQEKLAAVFNSLPVNDLKNPLVKKAYKALTKALKEQFAVLPVKVEIQTLTDKDGNIVPPYNNNSAEMRRDILERNHMLVYPTTPETFGPEGYDFSGHPLLENSGFKDINGTPMLFNDVLRAVHDYFAHGMSEAQFGPKGEFTAWRNHMASTPDPMARWALTAETRMQNAWQNFSKGAQDIPLKDRPFALQKAALPPTEFLYTGDNAVDLATFQMERELSDKDKRGSQPTAKLSLKTSFATPEAAERAAYKKAPPIIEAFKRWFRKSKVMEEGRPQVMYHASPNEFETFSENKPIFVTPDPYKAQFFSGLKQLGRSGKKRDYIYPLWVRAENPFDYEDGDLVREIVDYLKDNYTGGPEVAGRIKMGNIGPMKTDELVSEIKRGSWRVIETAPFQEAIKALGFDSFFVYEGNTKNLAVLNGNQVKSATGNIGEYGTETKNIRYSLKAPTTKAFKQFYGESKIVDKDGNPVPLYHATGKDFSVFKLSDDGKLGSGVYLSGVPEYAEAYALSGPVMPLWASMENPFVIQIPDANIEYEEAPFGGEYPEGRKYPYIAKVKPIEEAIATFVKDWTNGKRRAMDLEGSQIRELFKDAGYDGVVVKDEEGNFIEVNVFEPTQIKSATGNVGAFGQRAITAEEAKLFGMTEAEANKAQKEGDIRFSLRRVAYPSVKEAQEAADAVQVPDTDEFKQYIAGSQWLDEDGKAKKFFHATTSNFFEFDNGVIHLSETARESERWGRRDEDRLRAKIYRALNKAEKIPLFQQAVDQAVAAGNITQERGERFMRDVKRSVPEFDKYKAVKSEMDDILLALSPSRMKVMPLYARAMTPFDFRNPDHVNQVGKYLERKTQFDRKIGEVAREINEKIGQRDSGPNIEQIAYAIKKNLAEGYTKTLETPEVQEAIRALGFDGYNSRQNREAPISYAVYKPQQVKSITGNDGQFSLETKDMRYSLKKVRYTSDRFDNLWNQSMYTQSGAENKTKGYLAFVDPMDFVRATSSPETLARLREEQEPLDLEKMRAYDQVPYLTVSEKNGEWKITGHEGRHRMLALHEAGYRDIPVYIHLRAENAKSIPVKTLSAEHADAVSSILMAAEVEPLSYANKDKAMEKFTRMESKVKYSLPSISAADRKRMNEVAPQRYTPSWKERVIGAFKQDFTKLRQQFLNRYESLAVYDRMLREMIRKSGGPELLADQSAEFAALQSDLAAGVAASAMGIGDRQGGVPVYRNGVTTIDTSVKGLVEALAPLAKYGDPEIYQRYQFWAGWKRGRRLLGEIDPKTGKPRERLYEPADAAIAARYEQMHPEFVQVQKDLIAFNDGIVNYAVQTGVLSKERARVYTQYADYIPFYRQFELDKTIGPNPFSGISGVKGPKALKGGESPLGDFMENMVRNTQSLINAGMKNVAAQRATDVAMRLNMGLVQRLPGPVTGIGVDAYTVLENGQLVYYRSADPLFVQSLASLNMPDLPFMGLLSTPANALRNLVTKDPGFMFANLLRDSLSAYVTSGQNITPVVGTVVNFGKALSGKDKNLQALFNAGVIGGYEFSQNIQQSGKSLAADLNRKAGQDSLLLRPFKSLWEGLEKGTTASDAATRMAVYERVMEETGGNEAEAISRALEVMNFNRKGSNVLIRVATAALPFFNARLQGLDLFYRASTGRMDTADAQEIKRKFWVRGLTMASLSVMYYMAVAGDPDYEKQEEETKDNNWIFPSLGIRIPIPFEVGTLFKTVPERITAYIMGNDTGKDLKESSIRALANTFAFNPIPQTFKPLIEVATNYNFFTMRSIVGQGMQDVAPQFQVGPGTSKTAEWIGEKLGMSPLKIDQLIKGYTGTMGGYVIDVVDAMANEFSDVPKASKRFEQMPIIKRFVLDKEARGSVTQFYELQKAVDTFVRTSNLLEKTARPEEYLKYVEENIGMLAAKDYVQNTEKTMKELREMRKAVNSLDVSPDEKRDMLLDIGRGEINLTANIKTIKKAVSEVK